LVTELLLNGLEEENDNEAKHDQTPTLALFVVKVVTGQETALMLTIEIEREEDQDPVPEIDATDEGPDLAPDQDLQETEEKDQEDQGIDDQDQNHQKREEKEREIDQLLQIEEKDPSHLFHQRERIAMLIDHLLQSASQDHHPLNQNLHKVFSLIYDANLFQ